MANGIDASLGLALALDLLKEQQDTGELQCIIPTTHMFKTKRERAIIQIRDGFVVACTIIDEHNHTTPTTRSALIRLDEKRGNLEWKFLPLPVAPPSETSQSDTSRLPVPLSMPGLQRSAPVIATQAAKDDDAIPERLFPELHLDWLQSLPAEQIRMLQWLWPFIDGERSVGELKALLRLRLSSETVERMLMFLIAMHHIMIRRKKSS